MKVAHEIGIKGTHLRLPEETTEEELLSTIDGLNENQQIHGIMLQLPLGGNAQEIDVSKALDLISPSKDVDCIGAFNRGVLMSGGMKGMTTCTPRACMELIKASGKMIQGARAVVIGRSVVVGGMVAEMLKWSNATVINCHEHTINLKQ